MSIFPTELDTDLEIPRVEGNVTEISGDTINAIRDAVFNIEKTIGVSAQGNLPSLTDRVNELIDSNGRLKVSALDGIGLVSLPITNSHVGAAANIVESKLNLDFSTQSLQNSLNSTSTSLSTLQSTMTEFIVDFNNHVSGVSGFHDGYSIKINRISPLFGIAGMDATTVGDAINEFATILLSGDGITPPHIDTTLAIGIKHRASAVSVDASGFSIISSSVSDVQGALASLDSGVVGQQNEHRDAFHANGILKEINSGEFFNANQKKISAGTASYTAGTTVISISGVTSYSDLNVKPGDILQITSAVPDAGTFRVRAVGPITSAETLGDLPVLTSSELSVYRVFNSTEASVVVNVYKAASISSEDAPLACSVRNSATLADTISILNPNAARVVSLGFNGAVINGDGYDLGIDVGFGSGQFRTLTIPDLNRNRLGVDQPDPVDAQSVVERINAYVANPDSGTDGAHHFPITAYRIGNEISIAHNLVGAQYTLEILDGYTGNFALGLDAYGADVENEVIVGNESNIFSINGLSRSTINTVVSGTATITGTTGTFSIVTGVVTVNPTNLGIGTGSVVHITGHPTASVNGSYTLSSSSSTTITLDTETIPLVDASTTFNVLVTDSHVSLGDLASGSEDDLGLMELYINEDGYVLANQRLAYDSLGLGPAVEIINITDGFPVGDVTLTQSISTGVEHTFNITSDSVPGDLVYADQNFKGTFKVYHPNNIDYLVVKIVSIISGAPRTTTVSVEETLNLDETMRICIVHFNGDNSITNTIDLRQFGNISAGQVRDDFIEIFSQRPISDLRSNGVVRGFDVQALINVDSTTNMQALPLSGGVVYIDGVRVTVETQKVVIQSHNSSGQINGNVQKIIGINNFGTLRAFDDSLGEILSDGYNSSAQFGKILPLYSVTLDSAGLIDVVTDLRLFINNLDEKIELIVDTSNNVVGSFRSLEGALSYAGNYPGSERLTIKIINRVVATRAISVPIGVSLVGSTIYGGNGTHSIINNLDLNSDFITLLGDNKVENIEIDSEIAGMDGALIKVNGSNVNIEKCSFRFSELGTPPSSNSDDFAIELGTGAITDVNIVNNKIDNVFGGITSPTGCDNLVISNNIITSVVGTGAETYGILVGSSSRTIASMVIDGNSVESPSGDDVIGIKVNVGSAIELVRIQNNTVKSDAGSTMTGGIVVDNTAVTGSKITDLFILNNLVRGIETNGNSIFGIYANDSTRARISGNIVRDIATGSTGTPSDTAFIKIDSDVSSVEVSNNVLEDGDAISGIDIAIASGDVLVTGNIISDVGQKDDTGNLTTSTVYIRGSALGAVVSNNIISESVASSYGIHWGSPGNNSKISDNRISGDLSYTAITALGSNVGITNNTITGMDSGSVGIKTSSGSENVKISGNSISGAEMDTLIDVSGSEHSITNNAMDNITTAANFFIKLTTVSNSIIMGNIMDGTCAVAIGSNSSVITATTVSNNRVAAAVSTSDIDLGNTDATIDCFVSGNHFSGLSSSNIIGLAGTTAIRNKNLIGINKGLSDSITISMADGISAATTDGYRHWAIDDGGGHFWEPDPFRTITRTLYFPLNRVPNGAILNEINISGTRASSSQDLITATAFRKSVTDPTVSAEMISDAASITTNPSFTGTTTTANGLVTFTLPDDTNIVNYEASDYFLTITSLGGTNLSTIHGIKLKFTY